MSDRGFKYISATAALYFLLSVIILELLVFVKSISIPDEELLSEPYVGCTASYFV